MTSRFAGLTLEQKVGQLFFIGIPGPTVDDETRRLLEDVAPGGVCLFARNIRDAGQTRDLLDSLSKLLSDPLLSVDQEGGLVDRLRRLITPMPAANDLRDENDARRLGEIVGEALSILGFNMDFAPVVDVIDHERSNRPNGLFSREFGRSREAVVALAGSFIAGLESHGILNCLKHFPGLGAATVDSHESLPEVTVIDSVFEATDLYPYREMLRTANSVMVAHAAYPALSLQETDQNGRLVPSSLSPNFVRYLLRDLLGYDGLVITDDLEMGAIVKSFGMGEACRSAIHAGCDMLAICADPEAIRTGYDSVLEAVRRGEIDRQRIDLSVARIAAVKEAVSAPREFDERRIRELSMVVEAFRDELSAHAT